MDTFLALLAFLSLPAILFFGLASAMGVTFRLPKWSCRHGHCWHEGEDTIDYIVNDPGFSWGQYTWVCQICGAREELPPKDYTWNPLWVDDMPAPRDDHSDIHYAMEYRRRQRR